MKKNLLLSLVLILTLTLVLGGCTNNNEGSEFIKEEKIEEVKKDEGSTRTIKDLAGNEVEIPAVENIKRVIMTSPQLPATMANVLKDTTKIVGMHPSVVQASNSEILELVVPNWKDINIGFLTGYTSNVEEVLKLNPDIIFVYGEAQKEGLEKLDIPIVDFMTSTQINEEWSVEIDRLMREVFEVEEDETLTKEWNIANERVDRALKEIDGKEKLKGLEIFGNEGGTITVRGGKSYAGDWMNKSGLINLAADLETTSEVTMEQIYGWDPDIIYIFRGESAKSYLKNSIKGQDWSLVSAMAEGRVYDMPRAMTNWAAPCVDSPITLQWMITKNYPKTFKEEEFNKLSKEFYKRQYNIEVSDKMLNSILNPNNK